MRLWLAVLLLLIAVPAINASIEKWNYIAGSYLYSSPASTGKLAIFGSHGGSVYAVNIDSGQLANVFPTAGPVDTSPAVTNKTIYIGSMDGNLYAFDSATLHTRWNTSLGGVWQSTPLVAGGLVYVGSVNGNVYALKDSDGSLVWKFKTGNEVDSSPALSGQELYVASSDGKLYALDARNGSLLWSPSGIGGLWTSSPVVDRGSLYVGSLDGNLYAVSLSKHTKVWNFSTGGAVMSTPIVLNGLVIFGSNDYSVYAVDAQTGKLSWRFRTNGSVQGQPAFAATQAGGYTIYVGSNDGNVYALDAADGSLRWEYGTGGWVATRPLVTGSLLIVTSYSGMAHALSTVSCDFTSPADMESVGGTEVRVSGRAWGDSGVGGVEVRVNGADWKPASGTDVWGIVLPGGLLTLGENVIECRTLSAGNAERSPYNNLTMIYSREPVLGLIGVTYPQGEVGYGSDVTLSLQDERGKPLFGIRASWPGGSAVSDANGNVVVKASSEGPMPVELSAPGYETKAITLAVGRNWLLYGIAAAVVLAAAYFVFMYLGSRRQ
ncbi:Outer membrane protein assembly factor BamB [Candidatus Burarchaeum australiense]|nr:Outer membrane protein assembly factor BamB [Candidatus Burarchaeum australiense]